jgi:hypothetical protein
VCVSRLSCLFVSSAEVELLLNAKVHVTSGPIRTRQEEHYSWPSLQKDCSPRESPSDVTSELQLLLLLLLITVTHGAEQRHSNSTVRVDTTGTAKISRALRCSSHTKNSHEKIY